MADTKVSWTWSMQRCSLQSPSFRGRSVRNMATKRTSHLIEEVRGMKTKSMLTIATIPLLLAVLGGVAASAQDKYTLKVPGGLAFSEFRGYETWETISVSHNGQALAVILG